MPPSQPLPLPSRFSTPDAYISSLLSFSNNPLFRTLCGGVHILDFFTRDPSPSTSPPFTVGAAPSPSSPSSTSPSAAPNIQQDLYRTILPADWATYFSTLPIETILDLLLRTPLESFPALCPPSLRSFIYEVRSHSLRREFTRRSAAGAEGEAEARRRKAGVMRKQAGAEWALNAGMKPKKVHEVSNFAAYVDDLVRDISEQNPRRKISHILDYGSGQAYLSRTLAKKYGHRVVGIESRRNNIDASMAMDARFDQLLEKKRAAARKDRDIAPNGEAVQEDEEEIKPGTIQYIEKRVEDGDLKDVVAAIREPGAANEVEKCDKEEDESTGTEDGVNGTTETEANGSPKNGENRTKDEEKQMNLLLVSLHSCGNLVHHALRAFVSTPNVRAIALIGCCYNLMTEKLSISHKLPLSSLSSLPSSTPSSPTSPSPVTCYRDYTHPRLLSTSTQLDPLGFPLSSLLTTHNLSLNITARMMACQAPHNWTRETSAEFFKRHYFRALLQRIFHDRGLVMHGGEPVILGSLKKGCYASFPEYVRGAIEKLGWEERVGWTRGGDVPTSFSSDHTAAVCENGECEPEAPDAAKVKTLEVNGKGGGADVPPLTSEEIAEYERLFGGERRKEVSVVWSLMAFTAGVVESLIAVDRWVFLCEQLGPGKAWVECAFESGESPRNLVVVGVR